MVLLYSAAKSRNMQTVMNEIAAQNSFSSFDPFLRQYLFVSRVISYVLQFRMDCKFHVAPFQDVKPIPLFLFSVSLFPSFCSLYKVSPGA